VELTGTEEMMPELVQRRDDGRLGEGDDAVPIGVDAVIPLAYDGLRHAIDRADGVYEGLTRLKPLLVAPGGPAAIMGRLPVAYGLEDAPSEFRPLRKYLLLGRIDAWFSGKQASREIIHARYRVNGP